VSLVPNRAAAFSGAPGALRLGGGPPATGNPSGSASTRAGDTWSVNYVRFVAARRFRCDHSGDDGRLSAVIAQARAIGRMSGR
jgi:hypothetical protein